MAIPPLSLSFFSTSNTYHNDAAATSTKGKK